MGQTIIKLTNYKLIVWIARSLQNVSRKTKFMANFVEANLLVVNKAEFRKRNQALKGT